MTARIVSTVKLGTSLFVSLPADWVKSNHILKGAKLAMEYDDESIEIYAPKEEPTQEVTQ